jgi:hypothetical protein
MPITLPITINEAIELIEESLFYSYEGESGVTYYPNKGRQGFTTIGKIRVRRILKALKESPDA